MRSNPLFPPLERDADVNWIKIIKMESKSFVVLLSIVPLLQDRKKDLYSFLWRIMHFNTVNSKNYLRVFMGWTMTQHNLSFHTNCLILRALKPPYPKILLYSL